MLNSDADLTLENEEKDEPDDIENYDEDGSETTEEYDGEASEDDFEDKENQDENESIEEDDGEASEDDFEDKENQDENESIEENDGEASEDDFEDKENQDENESIEEDDGEASEDDFEDKENQDTDYDKSADGNNDGSKPKKNSKLIVGPKSKELTNGKSFGGVDITESGNSEKESRKKVSEVLRDIKNSGRYREFQKSLLKSEVVEDNEVIKDANDEKINSEKNLSECNKLNDELDSDISFYLDDFEDQEKEQSNSNESEVQEIEQFWNDFRDIDENDQELQAYIDKFSPESWEELDKEEKVELMGNFLEFNSLRLGMKEMPKFHCDKLECKDLDTRNVVGAFSRKTNEVFINIDFIDNPKEVLGAIAHECKHAQQAKRAANPKTIEDHEYKDNFDNYCEPDKCYEIYRNQLIEKDAFAYGDKMKEIYENREKERLRSNKRYKRFIDRLRNNE